MSTDATVVIKGRNELGLAVKQAEQQLKSLARTGDLVGKLLRGGAIFGAVVAFERLAENAQKAAEASGDRGAAGGLKILNAQIDRLKAQGVNIIGKVLGTVSLAAFGSENLKAIAELDLKIKQIQRTLEGGVRFGRGPINEESLKRQLVLLDQARMKLIRFEDAFTSRRGAAVSRGGGSGILTQYNPSFDEEKKKQSVTDIFGFESLVSAQRISLGAMDQFYADLDEKTKTAQAKQIDAWVQFETDIGTLLAGGKIGPGEATKRLTENIENQFDEIKVTAERIFPKEEQEKLNAFADEAARNMQTAFATFLFDPFKEDGLKGMLKGFVDTIRQMVAELAAQEILTAFFTWGSTAFGGGVGSFFGNLASSGARAAGGPVSGGSAYMVGERGPEMFVPGTSGTIIPNGGGGVTIYNTINANGADAERIMSVLPGLLKQNSDQTVARIRDLNGRGRL
jgi:hypothetical protein